MICTCVNGAYSGFAYGFVGAINFIAPAKRIREGQLKTFV